MKRSASGLVWASIAVGALFAGDGASVQAAVIVVATTIQAAVDAAHPGDIIVVPPGTYQESVLVNTDDLTIWGSSTAILDASGFPDGIHIGAAGLVPGPDNLPACPPVVVRQFTLRGLTIRKADHNGVFLNGVEGYTLTRGTYLDNGDYGPFPVCSHHGHISFNTVQGGADACIYVGNDVGTSLTDNHATGCTVGIEIENSRDVVVRRNRATDNTVGILAIVNPLLPLTTTENLRIEQNVIVRNNRPNQSTESELASIPSGTGILNVGIDQLIISENVVADNNTFGVVIAQNPRAAEDPRIEPNPEGNQVQRNVVLGNGRHPAMSQPGVDIVYDGSGTGNCFAHNLFTSSIPSDIETVFPCP
jgi:parallel beta-helix repeat protein